MSFLSKDISHFMNAMKKFTFTDKKKAKVSEYDEYFNEPEIKQQEEIKYHQRPIPSCIEKKTSFKATRLFGFGAKHPHIKKDKKWSVDNFPLYLNHENKVYLNMKSSDNLNFNFSRNNVEN